MGRYLFTLILVCFTITFQGQPPNGMIDQVWYLQNINIDNENNYVPLNENFNIIFNEHTVDYYTTANGVVNGFGANTTFSGNELTFTDTGITLANCFEPNCYYEFLYFDFLAGDFGNETFQYNYQENSQGQKSLTLTNENGNIAYYSDEPVVPNPAIFQTWYLHSVTADGGDTFFYSGKNVPQITIYEDFTYTAISNCWEISGNFEYFEDIDLTDFKLNNIDFIEECVLPGGNDNPLAIIYYFTDALVCELFLGSNSDGLLIGSKPGFSHYFKNEITLSIPENQLSEITIYPNPAFDKLNISSQIQQFSSIEVLDISGKVLKKYRDTSNKQHDISFLSAGVYFLSITTSEGELTKKFIKQ